MIADAHQAPNIPGLPDVTAAALFTSAQALSRMPRELATSIESVGLDGPEPLIATAAARIAATFGFVAVTTGRDPVSVRFERG